MNGECVKFSQGKRGRPSKTSICINCGAEYQHCMSRIKAVRLKKLEAVKEIVENNNSDEGNVLIHSLVAAIQDEEVNEEVKESSTSSVTKDEKTLDTLVSMHEEWDDYYRDT